MQVFIIIIISIYRVYPYGKGTEPAYVTSNWLDDLYW